MSQRIRGMSLVEVILALAILAGGLAMLGELWRLGGLRSTEAMELTKAQLYCQTVMAEIASGILPPESAQRAPVEDDLEWTYSVVVQTLPLESLIGVHVTVQRADDLRAMPLQATLSRWMIDPSLDLNALDEQAEAEDAAEDATDAAL